MPRMWMTEPSAMCQPHLLAEHHEHHVFLGKLKAKHKLDGYINHNLLEVRALSARHEELVTEMKRRGMSHESPFPSEDVIEELARYLVSELFFRQIDRQAAKDELVRRCPTCCLSFQEAVSA